MTHNPRFARLLVGSILASIVLASLSPIANAQTVSDDDRQVAMLRGGECHIIQPGSEIIEALGTNAGDRIAFVIGNGSYRPDVGWLENPPSDAAAIGAVLLRLGFEVYLTTEADKETITECFDRMVAARSSVQVGAFYYSGHGIQIGDENFIVPIDMNRSELEVSNLVSIDRIVDTFKAKSKVAIVFLDACRTNPFGDGQSSGLSLSIGEKSVQLPNSQPGEFIIAYATSPNATAADGTGEYSPFTAALVKNFGRPNVSVQQSLVEVTAHVGENTGWHQIPFTRSTLSTLVVLNSIVDPLTLAGESKNFAFESLRLLAEGQRDLALGEALKGIPTGATTEEINAHFEPAMGALRRAYLSKAMVLSSDRQFNYSAASSDGKRLLIDYGHGYGSESEVELWDAVSGQRIANWKPITSLGSGRYPSGFSFSHDSSKATVRLGENTFAVLSAETGRELNRIVYTEKWPDSQLSFHRLQFSPDDQSLIIADLSPAEPLFKIFESNGGALIFEGDTAQLLNSSGLNNDSAFDARFSFSGNESICFSIASGPIGAPQDTVVGVQDIRTGQIRLIAQYKGFGAQEIKCSNDGQTIGLTGGGRSGVVSVIAKTSDGVPLAKFTTQNASGIDDIHFSEDSRFAFFASDQKSGYIEIETSDVHELPEWKNWESNADDYFGVFSKNGNILGWNFPIFSELVSRATISDEQILRQSIALVNSMDGGSLEDQRLKLR